jgi:hypothetical protein
MGKDQEECRVTRAIKAALELIGEQNPELARFLRETIKTGEYLSYSPASKPTPRRKLPPATKTPHRDGRSRS